MDKENFKLLFMKNIGAAITRSEEVIGRKISQNMIYELHGAGSAGVRLGFDDIIDRIYISDTEFYRIIDILAEPIGNDETVVFVGVSGHKPAPFELTWNTPQGNGPFKVLEPIRK